MRLVLFDVPLPAPTDLGVLLFGMAAEPAGGEARSVESTSAVSRYLFAPPTIYGHARSQPGYVLLAWAEERELALAREVRASRAELGELRAEARKRRRFRSAARLRLLVDRVVWQLCLRGREPFAQASIRGLSLDRLRSRDRSGSFKFVIHSLEVLDATGRLDSAPGIAPGCILSGWNPDASWARDDMIRLVATFGVPTRTHSVYEHVDASVHPLATHFTEAIFVRFWEYFFPLSGEHPASDVAKRQAAFTQSFVAGSKSKHRRTRTAESSGGNDTSNDINNNSTPSVSGGGQGNDTPVGADTSGNVSAPSSSLLATHQRAVSHRRAKSDVTFAQPMTEDVERRSAVNSPVGLAGDGGRLVPIVGGAVIAGARLYLQSRRSDSSRNFRRQRSSLRPKFKHFRTNRMHCRVTYRGYPMYVGN